MAIVNGNNLVLSVGTSATRLDTTNTGAAGERLPFAHAQTVSLDFSNALIDVTTKDSDSWKEMISGQKSFSLSTDGLADFAANVATDEVRNLDVLAGYALAGTLIYFEFGVGDVGYKGTAYISSYSPSGGTDDAPTYSVSLEGTGELEYTSDFTS